MTTEIKFPVHTGTSHFVRPTVDFYYPYVYGLKDLMVQQKINYQIYSLMMALIPQLIQPDLITYVTGSYEIKTNERDVLSLTLTGMGDFHGAHPVTTVKSITMDVKTGKSYELYELFKPDSDYIKKLSDMIAVQIKEREIPLLEEFKGIRPDQDYYIADKGLVIYFQQVEIAPYYVGLPYFLIPIYDLSDMIAENGILERMLYWL